MAKVTNPAAELDGNTIVLAETDQEVSGLKAFRRAPDAPFEVEVGSATAPNLDADMLDGEEGADFHDASKLDSGTIPGARFPAVLPAVSAAQLTSIPAAQLTGTVPSAAFPNPLPAVSGENLTDLPDPLPAVSGENLTDLAGGALVGDIPDASVPVYVEDHIAAARKLSIVCTIYNPAGITTTGNIPVWVYLPKACTVKNVRGYRVGGTGATINARRNGTENFLASALSLTSADTQMDGGAVQNTALAVGDKVEAMLVSVTGSPTVVVVQIDVEADD
jgi:hypothetical protein